MLNDLILKTLDDRGYKLTRCSNKNGGEYHGPCPFCGGTDRCNCAPNHPDALERGGLFYCRQCGAKGNGFQLLKLLGLDVPKPTTTQFRSRPISIPTAGRAPKLIGAPGPAWQKAAKAFVDTRSGMWGAMSDFLLTERGITLDTAKAFKLGINTKDSSQSRESWGLAANGADAKFKIPVGIVIPYFRGDDLMQVQVRTFEDGPKYLTLPGSVCCPVLLPADNHSGKPMILVESFLDGLLLWQEARDLVTVIVLGSTQARPDTHLDQLLRSAQ